MGEVQKRGQAALEFLTTYGWAFLVILVAIAAIAYVGGFDYERYVPDRCNFGGQFSCLSRQFVLAEDHAAFTVRSLSNTDLVITDISYRSFHSESFNSCAPWEVDDVSVSEGEDVIIRCYFNATDVDYFNVRVDQKARVYLRISHRSAQDLTGSLARNSQGEIYANVEALS